MRAVAHGQAARPEGPDSVSGQDVRTCWTPNPSEDVVSGLCGRTEWPHTPDSLIGDVPDTLTGKKGCKNSVDSREGTT